MHVFVTGGTGHSGPYIISDLIAAGHEVTALVRSQEAADAVTALGATPRHGSLEDLEGSDRQSERSIEDQVRPCRARAEQEGWTASAAIKRTSR